MNLDKFLEKTGRTEDGRPVVTLMTDPEMHDPQGVPVGFVSLVTAGANGRPITATKAADEANPLDGPRDAGTQLAPGQDQPIWRRWFTSLFGAAAGLVAKGEDGVILDFDAAIAADRLRRARWESTEALWTVITGTLASADVTDKPAAVGRAIDKFKAHVLGLVGATAALVAKGEGPDLEALRVELGTAPTIAAKAGRVISAANLKALTDAQAALSAASEAISALIKAGNAGNNVDVSTAAKADQEDLSMLNAQELEVLARKGSDNAVTIAKSAGVTDATRLVEIGTNAFAQIVAKAGYQGADQPAMTPRLQDQMSQSGGMEAAFGMPMDKIKAALASIPGLVAKVAELEGELHGTGEGDKREPGVTEIAAKAIELATHTATVVQKSARIPARPNGATETETERETAAKSADPAFEGTPFDFRTTAAKAKK